MNKEPIGLYILRYVLALGLFGFMVMLYWSSVLIEQDVRELHDRMIELHNDIDTVRTETSAIRSDVLQALNQDQNSELHLLESLIKGGDGRAPETQQDVKPTPQQDAAAENLLTPDPFYKNALPKLLGDNFHPTGTRKMAIVGKPENLHPFSNWSHVSAWTGQCTVSVAQQHFGIFETMAPDMAERAELRKDAQGREEYWIFLRDRVFWEPLKQEMFPEDVKLAAHFLRRHQVTADDFKFYFDAVMNSWVQQPGAVSLRTYLQDIEEFRVVDKLTFAVRWKTDEVKGADGTVLRRMKYSAKALTGSLTPLASFVYKYFPDGAKIVTDDKAADTYRTNSVWAQNFNQHWARHVIVSCGPWIFTGMTDQQITFVRNPDYYQPLAALSERMEVQFKDAPEAIWQDFKMGKLDTYELRPDELLEYENFLKSSAYQEQKAQKMAIHRLDYVDRSFTYVGWNEARIYFQSPAIRRALTLAIDRRRIIQQSLNGMGIEINGPFYRYSKSYDASITPWPYDPMEAKRLLTQEGWYDRDGDGVVDKLVDGKRVSFRFTLTYYVRSPTAKAIAEYIQQALKEIDVVCDLRGVDITDLGAVFDDKDFDAVFLAWAQGAPPEDPKQLWDSSGAKEKGSSNAIGFANKEVDGIINALQYEYDPKKRIALYHRFDAIIHQEAPYAFLYTPKASMLYREYVQNVFLPVDRQDLIPGADVAQPQPAIFWLKEQQFPLKSAERLGPGVASDLSFSSSVASSYGFVAIQSICQPSQSRSVFFSGNCCLRSADV